MLNFTINIEHLAISLINEQGTKATLSLIYRPPSSSIDSFIENFDKLLFELKKLKHECFVTGDFNIDMRKETNENKKLTSVCESYNLEITSYEATRVTATTSTCIDLFIANKDNYSSEVKKLYISDHYAVVGEVNFVSQNGQKKRAKVKYRKFDNLKNPSILITFLFVLQHELQKLLIFSAAEQLQKFPLVLLRVLDIYAPEKIRKRKEIKQVFISNRTKRLMKQRDKAAKQNKAENNAANREKFCVLRNKVVSSLRMDEKHYYEKSLKDQKDPKKIFKKFNQISKAKKSSCSISVNKFNNFFANVGSKITGSLSNKDHRDKLNYCKTIDSSMFVFPTSEKEILDIIKCLKKKSSCGHDGVSNMIVKISATVIAPFLAKVFNECLKEGVFPNSLKIAKLLLYINRR